MTPIAKADVIEVDPIGKPPRPHDFLIDLIVEEGHTRTPVKREGRIIGYVHCNDLLPFLLTGRTGDLLQLVKPAMHVPHDRRVADLLQDFRQSGKHMGFVADAAGTVVGLVTLEDVLEEITGEILDEYDIQPPTSPA
jgi:CBS domain containing-hemolysin-like protein